ncbi:MAG: EAL domain-containing protein [Gammaproteobacteria bacterium]|nr:EAL domain-containing protein [Gammaproteobacteria bacterium]
MTTLQKASFLSLKWKAGILFGIILFLFNATFPVLVYWNLNQKFVFSRTQIQQQFHQNLSGQLKLASDQLQGLAELTLIPDNSTKTSDHFQHMNDALSQHQSELELNWNVSVAQHLSKTGELLGGWGGKVPQTINDLILSVINSEQPNTLIECSYDCKQYDIIPILINGFAESVLVLGYDLSNTILAFTEQTGADLAVLTKNDSTDTDLAIPEWQMTVSALSNLNINLPLLQSLASRQSLTDISHPQLLRYSELPVEFYISKIQPGNTSLFVIIDDISAQRQEITDITYQSIFISAFGVVIFGVGLFLFLSKPLTRLSAVSHALPLLALQQFDAAHKLVKSNNTSQPLDELDLLEQSAQNLTGQLETLHASVKERTAIINQRNVELQQERDFIKSLIDTAQVIIITIDRQCKITSFNDFAEQITGYSERDAANIHFSRLFPTKQWPDIEQKLIHLKKNRNSVTQHESEFINQDGSSHIISWLHSSLANPSDKAVILSIGLDITEQKLNQEKLIWLADHDILTNLYNRRRFKIEFEKLLLISNRYDHQGSLFFLDLDQFKDINDSCGHTMGDKLLERVAQSLLEITRDTDIVARLGGDEFAVLLPETTEINAINFAEKVCKTISLIDMTVNNIHYKISASIGLITFPQADLTVDDLISNADLAMYQAKAKGKNTWHQFALDDKTRDHLASRILWKNKIEAALEHNRFIFHYQPIMDIRTRTVSHYEVLIRMQDDDGTIHYPDSFIEIAEQTGLIHAIDHYVLQQGIEKQAQLDRQETDISLSINLSGHAADDPLLVPLLKRLLKESHANPEHLIFELTETAAVADMRHAKQMMTQLKTLGCRFSLDDFGTGFASFRYMRELPVDIVKIDGSFISNLHHNPDDQLFVKALVDVARGMGKKTIAEFVENAEILALLHTFGVDYAQGYFVGKPKANFLDAPPELN